MTVKQVRQTSDEHLLKMPPPEELAHALLDKTPAKHPLTLPDGGTIRKQHPTKAPYSGVVSGRWNLDELVNTQLSARLMNGEKVQMEGWLMHFDETYSCIRLMRDVNGRPINIKVEPERNLVTSLSFYIAGNRSEAAGFTLELEALGIFKPGSAEKLGFTPSELSTGEKAIEKIRKLELLNVSDLLSLKNSFQYTGKNTVVVHQHEAVITEPGKGVDGIYTFGAGPCSIVIALSKDPANGIKHFGMAHIGTMIPTQQITQFLDKVKEGSETLEVYVISGDKNNSLRVIESCETTGAQIKFFSANLMEDRNDSAIVDSQGIVYYGKRQDLNALADMKKMERVWLQAEAGSASLSIRTI